MVGTADRSIIFINLDPQPQMARKDEMQLKYHYRWLTIFRDKVRICIHMVAKNSVLATLL